MEPCGSPPDPIRKQRRQKLLREQQTLTWEHRGAKNSEMLEQQ